MPFKSSARMPPAQNTKEGKPTARTIKREFKAKKTRRFPPAGEASPATSGRK